MIELGSRGARIDSSKVVVMVLDVLVRLTGIAFPPPRTWNLENLVLCHVLVGALDVELRADV